uniref:Defensin-like protein n=1 Tax=Cajanus cajan TaxID=3821 RepID=A0A151T5H8_CAJCA|nr:hypothetical protein KK1_016839 [Cajanus cajan]
MKVNGNTSSEALDAGIPPKTCTDNLGPCGAQCNDICCDSKCGNKYSGGIGICKKGVCTCQYVCGPGL